MTAAPKIKGWCPGALRPMQSGDGLLVRIRPPGGTLSPSQAQAIARASIRYGNGIIDLSSRANLQLRGVTEATHGPLIADLRTEGLIDPDIETESLRNLIITPFRGLPNPVEKEQPLPDSGAELPSAVLPNDGPKSLLYPPRAGTGHGGQPAVEFGGDIDTLALEMTEALTRMPGLPGKFGFALDAGLRPVLTGAPADIRVERCPDGRLILRPDGYALGRAVADLANDALALVEWFVAAGGVSGGRGRMAALIARGIVPPGCTIAPADPLPQPGPGLYADGALVALAFGQMQAATLDALAALCHDIRPTPWRMLFLAGARHVPVIPGLILDPADPLLRVTACTGAPACPQALGDTRALARALAPHLPQGRGLHVSGCTKGCAHPGPADFTLTASASGHDLIHNGKAADKPSLTGLAPQAILDPLKAAHAPRV